MFKNNFTRYTVIFMTIIVLSFSLLSSIISSMMADYYTEISDTQLISAAQGIEQLLEDGIKKSGDGDNALRSYVRNNTESVSAIFSALTRVAGSDFSLYITDDENIILYAVGSVTSDAVIQSDEDDGEFTEASAVGMVLSDEITSRVGRGVYHSDKRSSGILRVGKSSYGITVSDGEAVLGSIFVCTTAESVNDMIGTTVRAILMTCLWMALAVLVAVYFITERISAPLKEMSVAAKAFAKGKFDTRITVRGSDDIASLAVAMNNMAASMEKLEKTRSDFLSSVSHDLRTPMTTISGFIDALLDDTIPKDKQPYYLRLIGDEVRRLSRLVAALLDVSRLQSGDRKFVMKPFDICEMGRIILISFEQKLEKKGLDVEFDTDSDTIYACADHDAVYQIFYNICDNAVKFSSDGGKYSVSIKMISGKINVSVYNEGQGIPADDLPRVFDRFYKGDKSRGLDKTGTGLGMYIAKSIIDAHGEEIWVESEYGEYCRFTFTLSRATDAQAKKMMEEKQNEKEKNL